LRFIPPKIQERVRELRVNATRAEIRLLLPLQILCRAHHISLAFQYPLQLSNDRWVILDFIIGGKTTVELDGKHHFEDHRQRFRDRDRDERLKWDYSIKTTRFPNSKVLSDPIGAAINLVDSILEEKGSERKISRYELEAEIHKVILERLGLGFPGLL
jgi:very-short-patch-repair endonuclease